jgi:hypothetical protein
MSLFVTTPNNSLKSNIEQFWGEMGKLDDIFSGTKRFGVLSKLAKTLLKMRVIMRNDIFGHNYCKSYDIIFSLICINDHMYVQINSCINKLCHRL